MKETVKRIKRQKGWTSAQLAECLGCGTRTVEGWLIGKNVSKPYIKALKNIRMD